MAFGKLIVNPAERFKNLRARAQFKRTRMSRLPSRKVKMASPGKPVVCFMSCKQVFIKLRSGTRVGEDVLGSLQPGPDGDQVR